MENYIIKIYRRDKSNPGAIVGQFQNVLLDTYQSFKHVDDLVEMLTSTKGVCRQSKKKSQGRPAGLKNNK